MRTSSVSTFVVCLFSFVSVAAAQDFDAAGEQAMLDRINAVRAEAQLAPLVRMPELDTVARAHSVDMASHGALMHVSATTGTPDDRVHRAGVDASTIAENVALHRDSARAMDALLASPPHHANILNASVTHVGLGSVITADGVYVTQVFAQVRPAPEIVAEQDPSEVEGDDGSIFQIIPPFIEQALGAAAPVVSAPSEPAPAPAASTATAQAADTQATTQTAPAPSAAAPTAPATSAPTATLPPATAATLRQLVGLAQSLLGATAATTDAE